MGNPMAEFSIVLLAGEGPSTRVVYHALRKRFGVRARLDVILEAPVARTQLLRRRVRRLGVVEVVGQVLFLALALPLLRLRGRTRVEAIESEHGLNDASIPEPVHRVPTANGAEARRLLAALEPKVVVVNGTRILSAETLSATRAPFLNMHAGITPAYRGVHGGYWARIQGDWNRVGTTVHLVDEGIDTGRILRQVTFTPERKDTFWTYPYLHTAAGVPILLEAVEAALAGELEPVPYPAGAESRLWYHPTVWGYVAAGLGRGLW
jgi:folate-dependent phosphoribosylglycinamide formyltransferase PurN